MNIGYFYCQCPAPQWMTMGICMRCGRQVQQTPPKQSVQKMNQRQAQSVIARLNIAIGLLSEKSERPEDELANIIRGLISVRETVQVAHKLQEEIFARMTPEAIAGVLESIATDIKDEQGMTTEMDVLHLRQIADWLEQRIQAKEAQG